MRETVFPILSSDELVRLAAQQQESTVTVGVCLEAGACFHHAPAHRTVKTLDPCVQILLLMPQMMTEIAKQIVMIFRVVVDKHARIVSIKHCLRINLANS